MADSLAVTNGLRLSKPTLSGIGDWLTKSSRRPLNVRGETESFEGDVKAARIHRLLRKAYVGVGLGRRDGADNEGGHVADTIVAQSEHNSMRTEDARPHLCPKRRKRARAARSLRKAQCASATRPRAKSRAPNRRSPIAAHTTLSAAALRSSRLRPGARRRHPRRSVPTRQRSGLRAGAGRRHRARAVSIAVSVKRCAA